MRSFQYAASGALLLCTPFASALKIDVNNTQSISNAAKTIAENIISIYDGGNGTFIPGLFPKPYYWWNAGLAFDSLLNYWALTGDDTYNDLVSKALLFQIGEDDNYMPANQSSSIGNDDQATWGLAAMTAAEKGFPNPPSSSGVDSWLELAENVFNAQVPRWDTDSCDGGLRWQIFPFNAGYDYKNTMSNGDFMQLAARLFRYTGNETYSDWASKVSEWSLQIGLIDKSSYAVYDGTSVQQNCRDVNHFQWTVSLGSYLSANIYLYNATQADDWKTNIAGLYTHFLKTFINNGSSVITEVTCAPNHCNNDQQSFRAVLARALANAEALAPSLEYSESLKSVIDASAQGAAGQCSGGSNGTTCGSNWATTKWDGSQGLGQDLSALEAILAAIPSAGVRTDNSTGTTGNTGGSSPGGSQTSSGASPSSTNGAVKQGASLILSAAALLVACLI